MAATVRAITLVDEVKRAEGSEPILYQADLSSLAEVRSLARGWMCSSAMQGSDRRMKARPGKPVKRSRAALRRQ